jgi:hypothetical protein
MFRNAQAVQKLWTLRSTDTCVDRKANGEWKVRTSAERADKGADFLDDYSCKA